MPNSYVIHLPHYLDERGNLPTALPAPAATLALYFGSIVAWISSAKGKGDQVTNVICRRSRARPPCRAEVYAWLASDDGSSNGSGRSWLRTRELPVGSSKRHDLTS